jgi:hypothetical protein
MKKITGVGIAAIFLLSACGNAGTGEQKDSIAVARQDSMVSSNVDTATHGAVDVPDTSRINVPGKEVLLQFNLEKGKSYAYDIAMDIGQQRQESKINTGMNWKYTLQVMNADGKVKTIRVTYDHIAMSMDMGGQKMEFNSDAPMGDPSNPLYMITNLFSAMKGKSFSMTVDNKGEVRKVEGIDKLGEELVSGLHIPPEYKERMLKNFRSQFNENDIKATFSQTFSMLPGKKIKEGDSWEKESVTKVGPTKGKMLTIYTVESIKGNIVKLSGKGKLLSEKGVSTGIQSSRLTIDAPTGLVLQNVFDITTEGQNKITTHGTITGKRL